MEVPRNQQFARFPVAKYHNPVAKYHSYLD